MHRFYLAANTSIIIELNLHCIQTAIFTNLKKNLPAHKEPKIYRFMLHAKIPSSYCICLADVPVLQ